MSKFNLSKLKYYFPTIDLNKLDPRESEINENILNIISEDSSLNINKFFSPNVRIKKKGKTSRGLGGKMPDDEGFNIESHINYLNELKNLEIPNMDIKKYLFILEINNYNIKKYTETLKNKYNYDIYN
tara:strand:+ start:542 stop:925 length:384 start_codon:yes stop_codon:yes gene_type:complete